MKLYLTLVAILGTCACGSDFESSPGGGKPDAGDDAAGGSGGSSGSSGSAGSSGNGGSAGCPSTHRCVPPAPSNWTGPFAHATSGACSGTWAQTELTLHEGLNAPPAECNCECTPMAKCPDHFSWYNFGVSACSGTLPTPSAVSVGECKVINSLPSHGIILPPATPGCTTAVAESIPPATWNSTHYLCSGAKPGGSCSGPDSCLPQGETLCVSQPGDQECPENYPQKLSYFTGVTDDRDCPTGCGCSATGPVSCESVVSFFASNTCSGATNGSVALVSGASLECVFGTAIKPAPFTQKQVGTCSTDGVAPIGGAVANGPVTVCCTP